MYYLFQIDEYFAQLPNHKVPRWSTAGEKYREKQLILQLPKQDLALAYCQHLDKTHKKSFEDFVNIRNEIALDIAYVREYLDRQNVSDFAFFYHEFSSHIFLFFIYLY